MRPAMEMHYITLIPLTHQQIIMTLILILIVNFLMHNEIAFV